MPKGEECASESECTVSTKKVIERTREMNSELAELIAERERLISRLVDFDKILDREVNGVQDIIETIAPVSTTSKAVESSNSPAVPVLVVTKAPVEEKEANYIIVEEDAISKVYFEMPEDLRDKYHDESSGSEDELAEDLNMAFHGYANLMEIT